MKLNPNSWHARWYTWRGAALPYDLCSYMWGLLFRTLGRLSVAIFWLFVAALMIDGAIRNPYEAIAIFLSIISIIGAFVSIFWSCKTKSGIVFLMKSFLKAKKDKYCPMIDWKDEQ